MRNRVSTTSQRSFSSMHTYAIPLIGLGFVLAVAAAAPSTYHDTVDSLLQQQQQQQQQQPQIPQQHNSLIDKRASERYGFGLGRRAFSYTSGNSGVKRLPVYNFGLGKRGGDTGYGGEESRRPYSFGLGKRAGVAGGVADDDEDSWEDARSISYDAWPMNEPRNEAHQRFDIDGSAKRARPYSFGLGKRLAMIEEASVERRGAPQRYNFGLGKR